MSNRPKVSVVIPCRNESESIEKCLASVLDQATPNGGFEVIVADGMSDDGTCEVLARWTEEGHGSESAVGKSSDTSAARCTSSCSGRPKVRVIENPGRIVSSGLNAAIRAARGEVIVRMDAHTEYAPDYLRQCVTVLEKTGADNVGGPWLARGHSFRSRCIAAAFQSAFAVGGARSHQGEYAGDVDSVYLGCWRRDVFERFGWFDEDLVRNQDDEHNLRIVRGGGRVFQEPTIRSWYQPRGSLAALFRQYQQYGYWKVRVIQKHRLPASWRHLVPGFFVLVLLLLLAGVMLGAVLTTVFQLPSSVWKLPLLGWAGVIGAYALALLAASVRTAAKTECKFLALLPCVFACYHLGYGWGFLRGVWDFVVWRRRGAASLSQLTRGAGDTKPLVRPNSESNG